MFKKKTFPKNQVALCRTKMAIECFLRMVAYDLSLFHPRVVQQIDGAYGKPFTWLERFRKGGGGSPPLHWNPETLVLPETHPMQALVCQHETGFKDKRQLIINAELRPKGWLLHLNMANRKFFALGVEAGQFKQLKWLGHGRPGDPVHLVLEFQQPEHRLPLLCNFHHRRRMEVFFEKVKALV